MRVRTILTVATLAAGLVGPSVAAAQVAALYVCDDPQITGATAAFDVTPEGSWVVGTSDGRVFRWSVATGLELLSPADWSHTHTAAVSDDGATVVSTVADQLGFFQPARWTDSLGWEFLGGLPGEPPLDGAFGSGYDISGDGSVVVGLGWHSTYRAEGFAWDEGSGVVGLGQPPDRNSRATAISADGTVVVGFFEHETAGYRRPARWIGGGPVDLVLGPDTAGEFNDASSDGTILVGQYAPGTEAIAFLFTDGGGLTSLFPVLDGQYQGSFASGVSDSGATVGWSGNIYSGAIEAAIWFPGDSRMRSLETYLSDLGVSVPGDVLLTTALAVSADGSTVVGQALITDPPPGRYSFFVATIPASSLFADGFESGDLGAWGPPGLN